MSFKISIFEPIFEIYYAYKKKACRAADWIFALKYSEARYDQINGRKTHLNSTVNHWSDTNGKVGDNRGTTDSRYQWNECTLRHEINAALN